MASKWVNKDFFNNYVKTRENQQTTQKPVVMRSEVVWPNPPAGTADEPKVYEGRFLQDPTGKFVERYFYHMWKSGDKWYSALCPKTYDFGAYCPFCNVVSVLYNGTAEDKKLARNIKRKERYVANFYIYSDPRDKAAKEEKDKNVGKVKLYELPSKVEEKIKKEIEDKENGYQDDIFDPGPKGHNFILEIKSTKPDAEGKTYPDYSSSMFARKAFALGKDTDIEKIMESCHSLADHIKGMERDDEKNKSILVSENLFGLIEREWIKNKGTDAGKDVFDKITESKKESDVPESVAEPETSDQDLMTELENLKM